MDHNLPSSTRCDPLRSLQRGMSHLTQFRAYRDKPCLPILALLVCFGLAVSEDRAEPANADARKQPNSIHVSELGAGQYDVLITYDAAQDVRSVAIAGTFNGWRPDADLMVQQPAQPDGARRYGVHIELQRGVYEYKFVVDGRSWIPDPQNPFRVGQHNNNLLFVGIRPRAPDDLSNPHLTETNMLPTRPHPEAVASLIEDLQSLRAAQAEPVLSTWLKKHPMPLFADGSITFVAWKPEAAYVAVRLRAQGSRQSHIMSRLRPSLPLFAVTVAAEGLPAGATYQHEIQTANRAWLEMDPHGWTVTSRGQHPATPVEPFDPARGRIVLLRDVKPSSSQLRPRDIYVYLPPGYRDQPDARFPVLYMHDGQNCWDDPQEPFGHGGWQVNRMADKLIAAGEIKPFIAVAIPNTADRESEYGPGKDILRPGDQPYLRFLLEDIKPLIDSRFRTRTGPANTTIMGSSMGGIISLQMVLRYPEVFGSAACLSPAFWFEDDNGKGNFDLIKQVGRQPVRVYLDSGTGGKNQDGMAQTREMAALMQKMGWQEGVDFMHFEDVGASHNERAWRSRLAKPLRFLFGSGVKPSRQMKRE